MITYAQKGFTDLRHALTEKLHISLSLGWVDIQQRYRRSSLGPLWITISMGVTVVGMGLIFGTLFGAPLKTFLPFLAMGLIIWTYITSVINEGCNAFTQSEAVIKQFSLPFHTYVIRLVWRNLIMFAHNMLIYPALLLVFLTVPTFYALAFFPGLILLTINVTWMCLLIAILCTRYRDITQVVASILQLWFFVTPIIWQPQLMIERGRTVFMDINPFYHLIELVRAPLLGTLPSTLNVVVCLVMAIVGWLATLALFGFYKKRIAYWL